MKRLLLFILGLFVLVSCQDEEPEIRSFADDFRYFPLRTGFQRLYDVEETVYRLNESTLELRYQLREEVGEQFISEGGETAFELKRYTRPDANENWTLDSIWVVRLSEDKIVRVENNVPFVSLRFPLREGATWDGNVFNTRRRDDYELQDLGNSKQIGDQLFANTLTVIQNQDSSLIDRDVRSEVYALDTGLVYLHREEIFYCAIPEDPCFGNFVIERGRELTYTLFAAGEL